MDWIDSEIASKKYNSYDKDGVKTYNKCNVFMDDMAQRGWGVALPRLKDDMFVKEYGYTSSPGRNVFKGNEEKPMSAASLDDYYEQRSQLRGSGVKRVPFNAISQLANQGNLVLVVGSGHATIAAPSKEKWPLIFRSDLGERGEDKRTRVGVKNPDKFQYYMIEPNQYNEFSNTLKESGYSDSDVYYQWDEPDKDSHQTKIREKYKKLHEMLREL